MIEKYKHLLPKITERGYAIDEQFPSSPHWSYTLLRVGTKGCGHIRKLLHKKKELDYTIHRLWSCSHSQKIWKFLNKILEEKMDSTIFVKEAMIGEYEENAASHRNITILYTKWHIDQAKREEKSPNLIHFDAALSNVLGTQFKFMQRRYDKTTKTKLRTMISSYYFFLSKLDQLRQEKSSY